MKKGLLATTALIGVGALAGGAAVAAEAPEWKLSGNMNFQLYWVDQDQWSTKNRTLTVTAGATKVIVDIDLWDTVNPGPDPQDHDWYFGIDEAELAIKVSGAADNGLKYGFKIELQTNTSDGTVADEAVISLSGGWGTLQLGDEDGAEDIMNYGGENLMGATGGFDGDQGDYLYRAGRVLDVEYETFPTGAQITFAGTNWEAAAPSGPGIAGDTSDHTKISYFSPRFSGFQVGASITPVPDMDGDEFKEDMGNFENHYGLGANYDNTFGNLRLRASAVFSAATSTNTTYNDISAYQVGGIVGFGPFSVGANYGSNGDSGEPSDPGVGSIDSWFYDVAASFETGPMGFAVGYFVGVKELSLAGESTYEHIALTADYKVAPGLSAYAELNMISDELLDGLTSDLTAGEGLGNDTTSFIIGINASF